MHLSKGKVLAVIIGFGSLFLTISAEITDSQMELVNGLPPDQRDALLKKMEKADTLQGEIEEVFDNKSTLVKRPEYEELDDEEIKNRCDECIFGYDFFKYSPTTFATSSFSITPDYILGPGDKLELNFFGSDDFSTEAFISREGSFFIPKLGPVNLSGMTFSKATEYIQNKVKEELIGVEVSINITELRSITVYMLGEAYLPGAYSVSGLSSVSNILFAAGGVSEQGSLRNIAIKRSGNLIATYDFYEFLTKGATNSDVRLMDSDVIFIPFIENKVELGENFKRPHIYEFIEGETIQDAINLAGGFNLNVSPRAQIELSSINLDSFSREVRRFSRDNKLLVNSKLTSGDFLNVSAKSGISPETITLSGEVLYPGEYSFLPSDNILDIILKAGGYTENSYIDGAIFLRKTVAEAQKEGFRRSAEQLEYTMIDAITQGNIEEVSEYTLKPIAELVARLKAEEPLGRQVVNMDIMSLKTDPFLNFKLQDGDELYIPKRPNSISVVGEVLNSASLAFDASYNVDDYIEMAGGLNESADKNKIFVVYPDGQARIIKRSLFSSSNDLTPGATIFVSRDSKPYDAIKITSIVTPILANLATSAAAIAAISD